MIHRTLVTRCWHDAGVGTGYFVLILFASALQFYKQETLRRTSPVAFAGMVKTFQGSFYLAFMVYRYFTKPGLDPLFDHNNHITRTSRWSLIGTLCIMGAATLALDTIAFIYLDLATKQVIDSTGTLFVFVISLILDGLLDYCKPVRYGRTGITLSSMHERKINNKALESFKVLFIVLMVVSSVCVVWSTPDVSFFGVTVNAITLITSAIGLIVTETLLKWDAVSKFGLMVYTIIPEIFVLSVVSWLLKEKWPTQLYVLHAGVVSVVETGLKILAFYLLKETSSVDLSVSGVLVFAIVVTGDILRQGGSTTLRLAAVSCTGVFFAAYSFLMYYGRKREVLLAEEPSQNSAPCELIDPVLGTPITRITEAFPGVERFEDIYRGPSLRFGSNQQQFRVGVESLQLEEPTSSVSYSSDGIGTDDLSGHSSCS